MWSRERQFHGSLGGRMSDEMGRYVMRVRAPFRVRRRSNGSVALYAFGLIPLWPDVELPAVVWSWGYSHDSLLAHRGSWLSWRDGVGFE